MKTSEQQPRINWRAIALLVIFLTTWSSPLAALAHPALDNGCTMACCEADSVCCCAAEHWALLAENPAARETPQLSKSSRICGAACAPLPAGDSTGSLAKLFILVLHPPTQLIAPANYSSRLTVEKVLRLKRYAPRAPPIGA